jgi:hypothetical protein
VAEWDIVNQEWMGTRGERSISSTQGKLLVCTVILPGGLIRSAMLLEDKIRDLCDQAVRGGDEDDALRILGELRTALHEHMKDVRDKLIATSSFSARRSHGVPKKAA